MNAAPAPSLFRQITLRMAGLLIAFVLVETGMVVALYATEANELAEDMVDLGAARVLAAPAPAVPHLPPPPGVSSWAVETGSGPPAGPDHGALAPLSWTRRDEVGEGVRISGVRSQGHGAAARWAKIDFVVRSPLAYAPAILKELLDHVAGPLAPLVVVLFIFILTSVRRLLRPLQRAVAEVDALSPAHPGQRLSSPAEPREVQALVDGFNRALERMDLAIDHLHAFSGQVAHELRTPIAVLSLAVSKVEPADLRHELQQDLAGMTRLVNQLLDLARAGALAVEPAGPVDLGELARQTVQTMAPLALRQGRDLRFLDRGGDQLTRGHGEAIQRALANLVDNALKYGGPAGAIDVTAGPGPVLSVRDHGAGIDPADAARMFRRFWRKGSNGHGGAGLGLEIVRTIAESHGGSVSAANAPDGGAVVSLSFPDG